MKTCTKCNHAVSDGEPTCPYCGCTSFETAGSDNTPLSPLSELESSSQVSDEVEAVLGAVDAEIDTELSDNFDFPPLPDEYQNSDDISTSQDSDVEQDDKSQKTDAPEKASPSAEIIADLTGRGSDEPGALEKRIKKLEKEEGALDDTAPAPSKLGIVLLAILIATVLALTVYSLVRYMRAPAGEDSQLLLEYMVGTWKSDPYVYSDDLSHGYVEVLNIEADGSFELTHLIPDPRNENGYEDGTWPVDSILTGTLEVYAEDKCIVFKYTEFGQGYYFDRYIVRMEDSKMAMREYYDDAKTQSFDIVFTKVESVAATSGSTDSGDTATNDTTTSDTTQ